MAPLLQAQDVWVVLLEDLDGLGDERVRAVLAVVEGGFRLLDSSKRSL